MRIQKRLVSLGFAALVAGCAAIESWDGFSGGKAPSTTDGGQPEASVDADPDAPATPSIEKVQAASTAIDNQNLKSVTVALAQPQRAGDLLVVVVGWFDATSNVTTVTDTRGNTYKRAVGPTVVGSQNAVTQSIYFAVPIVAANANTITVTFDAMADSPDIRVVEYAGIDTKDPLDATAAGSGKSTAASSGPATTHSAHELLIGAASTQGDFSTAGPDFNAQIVTTEANLVEDREVHQTGTYTATAPQPMAAEWVMQLVTFRGAI